jgi:hypothetical protein
MDVTVNKWEFSRITYSIMHICVNAPNTLQIEYTVWVHYN